MIYSTLLSKLIKSQFSSIFLTLQLLAIGIIERLLSSDYEIICPYEAEFGESWYPEVKNAYGDNFNSITNSSNPANGIYLN